MIDKWKENLEDQVRRGFENYRIERIDLSTARNETPYYITGGLMYIESVSSPNANATIRFNRNTNPVLDLHLGRKVKTVFTSFFITNEAQSGEWVELVIGINFDIFDEHGGEDAGVAQSVVRIFHASANTNVTGPDRVCHEALIKAGVLNTDIAWIDFRTPAVQHACFPLDPGEWLRVSIENLNLINCNFTVALESVYVVYEL